MRTKYFLALTMAVLLSSGLLVFANPPAGSGSVTGKVTYTGTPPKMKPIDMSKEPSCAKQHAAPITTQDVTTGPGNTLQWVVVYISAGDQGSSAAAQAARYDQKGCQYIPLSKANPEWNKSQPPGSPPIDTKYDKPEFIPVKCNIHPWMHGYFVVLNTSHYSVTGEDGSFDIKGLAPGKYTVTAWQERYESQSQEVTISGSEAKTVNFTFKVLPY
jgi:hypothetical protein